MFDPKISGITAGAAFIISLLVGLLSGAAFGVILLRAIVFAVVFFVLSAGAYLLVTRFLPELLDSGPGRSLSGSMVNITLGDEDGSGPGTDQMPVMPGAGEPSGGDELGDISGLMDPGLGSGGSGAGDVENTGTLAESMASPDPGLDQTGQSGYTDKGLEEENPFGELLSPFEETAVPRKAPEPAGGSSPDSSGLEEEGEALPDLDALAGDFNSSGEEGAPEPAESGTSVRRPLSAGGKPAKMDGDFNPKDIAAAIRDRLKREEG